MKRRLRRFLLIGAVVTVIDVGLLLVLAGLMGWTWVLADAAAVGVAAGSSFLLHRRITFADDAYSLIDHQPAKFAASVIPSLLVDVAIVGLVDLLSDLSGAWMVGAKLVAVLVAAAIRLLTFRRVLFAAVRSEQGKRGQALLPSGGPRVSVVLPAYRAAAVVADAVGAVRSAFEDAGVSGEQVEVVVVDDGSDDDTAGQAHQADARVVVLPTNRGKGAAVRAGMMAASGDTRLFTDVDLAYPPDQLPVVLGLLESGWDVVVGSRRHPATRTVSAAPAVRQVGSHLFNLMTHLVLLGGYRDTQCGLKGFSAKAAQEIFSRSVVDGFAFDVEVLHLSERLHLSLVETPVVLEHVEASTVRLIPQSVRMLRDVLAVRRRSAKGGYDLSSGPTIR